MKRTKVSDIDLQTVTCLVVGDSGIGKTTSIKTLDPNKTILANVERGLLPLQGWEPLEVWHIKTWDDIVAPVDEPERDTLFSLLAKREDPKVAQCKVVVLDSLSEVSDLCIRRILSKDRPELIEKRTSGKSQSPDSVYEDLMVQEDWNLYRTRMRNFLSALTHSPYHVVCTCLAAWHKDKDGGQTLRTPSLSGKLATECAAWFDEVLYMENQPSSDGKPHRVWRTFHDGRSIAKDASGRLDPYEETNWTSLFKRIRGAK